MNLDTKILEFIEYRKEIKKPIKEASKNSFLKRLSKLGNEDEETMIEILDQSIANGWQGIFMLQNKNNPFKKESPIEGTIKAYNQLIKNIENGTC